jgi:hypothetical protein
VRSRLPGLARHRAPSSPRGGEARGKAVVAQSGGHKAALAVANVRAPRIRRSVRAGDIYVMELELRNWKWSRNEEEITNHPAPSDP